VRSPSPSFFLLVSLVRVRVGLRSSAVLVVALGLGLGLAGQLVSCSEPQRASRSAGPRAPVTFAGPSGRRVLEGPWQLRFDHADRGLDRGFASGAFTGRTVRVPHSPNAHQVTDAVGGRSFQGSVAWYRTTFFVAAAGTYAVRFESVNHRARVWIDGRLVARHTGVYLPFEARAQLRRGRHLLVVRADWRGPRRMRATGWHRTWFNFGGVNREVTIRRLAASELDAPGILTRLVRGAAHVTISVRVHNRTVWRSVHVRGTLGHVPLSFPLVRLRRHQAAWVRSRVRIARPALWSPSRPALHLLRLWVPGEAGYVARVGLRELRAADGRLRLNGRLLRLRGASFHEDARGRGDALLPADMDATVARLRRIGANATRAHHPVNPALLERLDAAGILLWQGIGPVDEPGRWTSTTTRRLRLAVRRVRLSVLQERSHPSVLAWTLANEVAFNGHPRGQGDYVRRATRLAHRLDPGRLVALDVWGTHMPARAGVMYRGLDAIGATNYEGWYANLWAPGRVIDARIRVWLRRLKAAFPGKILVITEFGAEGNRRNRPHDPGGLAFQSRLIARHIRAYANDERLSGMLVWSIQDFALRPNLLGGSVRSLAPRIKLRRGLNEKGLFTYDGRPKPAADVVARLFTAAAR
jgi:hypothetical protein